MADHTPVIGLEDLERIAACCAAFHSDDGRELPTEAITQGLFWEIRDLLETILSGDPDMPSYDDDIDRAETILSKLETLVQRQ